jgi:hypothetical protein
MLYSKYNFKEALEVAYEEAYEEGIEKGKTEIALKALSMGFSIEEASIISDLDLIKVAEIYNRPPESENKYY